MIRRLLLTALGAAALLLVPWTVYLARTLPAGHDTGQWRSAWVGFDIALLCCFTVAAWLGLRRRRAAVPMLAATAALLCCDAWFDVVLDWSAPDRMVSVAMAVLVEIPLAIVLAWRARQLLTGGMPSRGMTVRDIELHNDPSYQRLTRELGTLGTATPGTLATALGHSRDEVNARLRRLAEGGYVRQGSDGQWRTVGQSLRLPVLAEVDEPDRPAVAAYLAAKYEGELRLLGWAAEHRDEFGPWGQGERAVTHLTAAELAGFTAEYNELLTRYCLLRDRPSANTREIAIRFYAFPFPANMSARADRSLSYAGDDR
ncbi:hypothetical protein SAMN05421504_104531 [Amycolatopsis xylanica]|uniref:Uncharacterized protein n=1 Tax=Amycolatopsis xylanica TaxID=589385 RepID=A0A1H3H5N9_9PSEU|nr:helix-turn-helix domain-containing protein [Amycolatopsis xylanica]SDY10893.1 hypothetical protein SAMN05421504_104531 [Amycolatopsis xylanica]